MEIKIQQNVKLSSFTTYGTGGPARYLAVVSTWQEIYHLREFAKQKNVPYLILGGGSNILFSDDGYPGLVIINQMDKLVLKKESVIAEGSVNVMKLILIAAKHNLGGISGLANLPGTIGGAIYGNAGIPDICIGDILINATILPENANKPIIVDNKYLDFKYRSSKIKGTKDIILNATLKLKNIPEEVTKNEIKNIIQIRKEKQPIGRSCGSFFKNPKEFPSAGWLIDQSGCKGLKVGDAIISDKHANFIMNKGNATSTDIINLAKQVYEKVKEKFNIELIPEVQILSKGTFEDFNQ